MNNRIKSLILLAVILFTSCIDENPDLVNPKPQNETMNIRLINLSGDKESRTLNMSSQKDLGPVVYDNTSIAVNPPQDSIVATITKNGTIEYKLSRKIKFLRESFYTAVCLPSPKNAERNKAVDTVVYFSTSTGLSKNTVFTYLKVFNGYPDSTVSFSVTLGCPNGLNLAPSVAYKQISAQSTIRAGIIPVSFMKNSSAGTEILGLYDLDLKEDIQYAIIVSEDINGSPEFRLLNEMNNEVSALYPVPQIYEKTAYVRTINFSTEALTIKKIPDEVIEPSISSNHIGFYKPVSACGSGYLDSIGAYNGSFESSLQPLSLSVNDRYTFITLDTKDKKAGQSYIIPQAKPDYSYNKLALVRVVNANEDYDGITLSIGARGDTSSQRFTSGEIIASKVNYSKISELNFVNLGDNPKVIPITLFTSAQPGKLLLSTKVNFEPGKSYIFVVYKNSSDNPALFVIEEMQEDIQLNEMDNMQFMQFVGIVPGLNSINIDYSDILNQARVAYPTSFATVAELGANIISLNGFPFSFDVSNDKRMVLIATGNTDNIELIKLPTNPLPSPMGFSQRRFVNAAKDISNITVRMDSDTGYVVADAVPYLSSNEFSKEGKERNFSLFFIDASNQNLIYRLNEINMIQGKSYTFVFGGSKEKGYTVYIIQDY